MPRCRDAATEVPAMDSALHQRLDGEALAALGTARIDDCAAAAGLHANEEAVGTGAANFGRLVCAFHSDLDLTSQRTGHKTQEPKPALSTKPLTAFLCRADRCTLLIARQCFRETRDYGKFSQLRQQLGKDTGRKDSSPRK